MKKRSNVFWFVVGAIAVLILWEFIIPHISIPGNWLGNFWRFLWEQKFGLAIGIIGTVLVMRIINAVAEIPKRSEKKSKEEPEKKKEAKEGRSR